MLMLHFSYFFAIDVDEVVLLRSLFPPPKDLVVIVVEVKKILIYNFDAAVANCDGEWMIDNNSYSKVSEMPSKTTDNTY